MVTEIFSTISEAVTGFGTALANALQSVGEMFYSTAEGAEGLTLVGTLAVIALGGGLVVWGFNIVRNLIKIK